MIALTDNRLCQRHYMIAPRYQMACLEGLLRSFFCEADLASMGKGLETRE